MSLLDTLKADVEKASTIEASVVQFIEGIAGFLGPLLKSGAVGEAAQLLDQAKARAPEFAEAVQANTQEQEDGADGH